MRYIGSKISTLDRVYDLVSSHVPSGWFCDPFGGIGSVGSFFKTKGFNVWSGDILTFPHFFQIAKIKHNKPLVFKKLLNELVLDNSNDLIALLNSTKPKNGWFVKEYSEKRGFFTLQNAAKIQACRLKIRDWAQKGWLNHDEHAVLLASLISSMDKVANTAGTYYAYLKKWHRKALKDFSFEILLPTSSKSKGQCSREPADVLVKRRHFNILYLDPPYNERSYAHYYHLPETIALEKTPKVYGQSGIPKNISNTSEFNRPMGAIGALGDVIKNASFDLLVFHYSDNGIISPEKVKSILSFYGDVEEFIIDSKGYTTKKRPREIYHHLYLVKHA